MQAHEFRMPRSTKPPLPARRPLVTVDIAALTIIDGRPHVLLARRPDAPGEPWPGAWALPGGFVDVDADASLEACARRWCRSTTPARPVGRPITCAGIRCAATAGRRA